MCIIFLYKRHVSDTILKPSGSAFTFVAASNRDEFFHRPASKSHFWKEADHILGGRDQTEGVEGGTWLGITRSGKFGALTNIRSWGHASQNCDSKKGRGSLIADFLKNDNVEAKEYLHAVDADKTNYRSFNLLLGNVRNRDNKLYYLNNEESKGVEELANEVVLTNGTLGCPWMKATEGLKKFSSIVRSEPASKDKLIEDLMQLLQDDTEYPEKDVDVSDPKRSVFVKERNGYGTRTNTVILVDTDDNVTFVERTIENTNDLCAESRVWSTQTHEFKIT